MRAFLAQLGTILMWIVFAPVVLAVLVVALPVFAAVTAVDDLVSFVRREPRVRLPETGVELAAVGDELPTPAAVAEAITSRCTKEVRQVIRGDGAVELVSAAAMTHPVLLRFAEDEGCEEDVVADVGPWTVEASEGVDHGEGDAAVAMAVAYLDHGLTCRVVKDRTMGLLWLADPGVWWRPTADGGWMFRQEWFRDLPGRPATATERAQHLASIRAHRSD